LAAVLLAAAVTAAPAAAQEARLDTIVSRDKLIVATGSTAMPTGFIDESGKLTGFEIEFAREIARSMLGSPDKVEFVITTVDGRFPAVLSGRADFGISNATVYPDRAMRLAFTRPYMDSTTFVVVKKGSTIKSMADLDHPDVVLGSVNSAAMVDRAKRFAARAKPMFFDTDSASFQALKAGRVGAVQTDSANADFQVAQSKGELVRVPGQLGNLNGNALFMKPGDFKLWLALDTIVGEYTHGSRYDVYEALFRKWFGRSPPPARPY
jgi:polar amino acid transport system substrate-binding protein